MDTLFGEPIGDVYQLINWVKQQGFESISEYRNSLENPEEYKATVSVLKARLKRIEELTKVNI